MSPLAKGFGEGVDKGQREAGYDVLSIEYTPNAERCRWPHVLVPRPQIGGAPYVCLPALGPEHPHQARAAAQIALRLGSHIKGGLIWRGNFGGQIRSKWDGLGRVDCSTYRLPCYAYAMYSDEEAASLYDVLNPWGPSDDFYLALVMDATSVLDVGCGTGALLHRARQGGHVGRLCGVDPDPAMLGLARRRTDIEWVASTAASIPWKSKFDLAIMTGHAFQVLIGDKDLRASLTAIRQALADDGRFAFETRNPLARAWEGWNPQNAMDVIDPAGRPVRISHEVESVIGDIVALTETTSDPGGAPLRVDRASLRFLDVDTLAGFLADAGFGIEAQYGGWFREPLDSTSPEIITVARV